LLITAGHFITSGLLAFTLLIVTALLGDKYGLPVINSWAVFHGIGFILLPVYFYLFLFCLRPIAIRLSANTPVVKINDV
jgi:hypothetical protein